MKRTCARQWGRWRRHARLEIDGEEHPLVVLVIVVIDVSEQLRWRGHVAAVKGFVYGAVARRADGPALQQALEACDAVMLIVPATHEGMQDGDGHHAGRQQSPFILIGPKRPAALAPGGRYLRKTFHFGAMHAALCAEFGLPPTFADRTAEPALLA